jgi:hypothetical protein
MNGLSSWCAALSAALLAAHPSVSHAQELGRLFFTPQERAALDARRKTNLPDKPAAANAEAQRARVDGYVLRPEGNSTVWVNGAPHTGDARIARDAQGIGRVAVPGMTEGLRVGESYDAASGEVSDLLGGGELHVVPSHKAAR